MKELDRYYSEEKVNSHKIAVQHRFDRDSMAVYTNYHQRKEKKSINALKNTLMLSLM